MIGKRGIHPHVGPENLFLGTPHTPPSDEGRARGGPDGLFRRSPSLGRSLPGLPAESRQSEKSALEFDPLATFVSKGKSLAGREVGVITRPARSLPFARRPSGVSPC